MHSEELLLESKESTVEISVEDVTEAVEFFEKHIQETIDSLRQLGLSPSAVEDIYLRNGIAKRLSVNTIDTTSSNVKFFVTSLKLTTVRLL